MLATIASAALQGISAVPVHVEVNTGESGEPNLVLVGLPDAAVKESRDRVYSAMANSAFKMPWARTTINLAPGNIRKEGPIYDLPIALGLLVATGQLHTDSIGAFLIAGELGLSGAVRPLRGALAMARLARSLGKRGLLLPSISANEAALVDGVEVYEIDSLDRAFRFLAGEIQLTPLSPDRSRLQSKRAAGGADFSEIKGQAALRRAVEVAVAGNHNLLIVKPISPNTAIYVLSLANYWLSELFMNLTESLSVENKVTDFGSELWTWDMIRTLAALFNSGGGTLRVGVSDDGKNISGVKNPGDFSADGSELAKTLHAYLDPVPPFESKQIDGYIEILVRDGVTSPTIIRTPLEHPKNKERKYPTGTVLMRRMNGGLPSSESPKTRSDWQTLIHLWETNRGITIQGQIIVQFALLLNQWNPFEPGGNTQSTLWQARCLTDVADPLGRPKLREGLLAVLEQMKPINERADFSKDQDNRGSGYKQPIARAIQRLCEDLGLNPPR